MSTQSKFRLRRQRVFLVLSGIFLGTLAVLNVIGISRFVDLSFTVFGVNVPMVIAVGVLPYPLTFLCTDLISELYGRKRAADMVWVGLLVNIWVMFFLWLGGTLPGFEQTDSAGKIVLDAAERVPVFFEIRHLAFGAVFASMVAYLTAQFCDVHLFHFWKRLTKGKHLWLRNNGSTLVSQLVDTTAVVLVTHFYAHALPIDVAEALWPQLFVFIASGYVFKMMVALVDTGPAYLAVRLLRPFLGLRPNEEIDPGDFETTVVVAPEDSAESGTARV
ncbi:MAG: queuosine precursor transporter [Gammaproteobacteria bacterium]|nr:queuosine precursor transporter [Gammaproteobacteria bacterium]